MQAAGFVVALTPYLGEALKAHADVVLPVGTFAETAGTFVNGEGRWQSFNGVASPVGESRPAWKVLRVLGNLLQMPDCEYASADEILAEVRKLVAASPAAQCGSGQFHPAGTDIGRYSAGCAGCADVPDRCSPASHTGPAADA